MFDNVHIEGRVVFAVVFPVSSMDSVMRVWGCTKGTVRGDERKRDEQQREELHGTRPCVNECSDKKSVERKERRRAIKDGPESRSAG